MYNRSPVADKKFYIPAVPFPVPFRRKNVPGGAARPENLPLTNLGMMVKQVIYDIPRHYPAITVDHAVVMPNHIHLLLQIKTDIDGRPPLRSRR